MQKIDSELITFRLKDEESIDFINSFEVYGKKSEFFRQAVKEKIDRDKKKGMVYLYNIFVNNKKKAEEIISRFESRGIKLIN